MLNSAVMKYDEQYPVARLPRLPNSVAPLSALARGRNFNPVEAVPKIVEIVRNDAGLAANLCVSLKNFARIQLDTGEPVNLTRVLMDQQPGFYGDLTMDPDTRDYEDGIRLKKFCEGITQAAIEASSEVPPIWSDTAYLMLIQSMMAQLQLIAETSLEDESPYLKKYSKFDELLKQAHDFTLEDYRQHVDDKLNMPRFSNPLYPAEVRTAVSRAREKLQSQLCGHQHKHAASA